MEYQDLLAESIVGNDALWMLLGAILVVTGNVYSERTLEFGGIVNAFLGICGTVIGWTLFIAFDNSPGRPFGIMIPFLTIAIYIYTSWLMTQERIRIQRFAPASYVLWLLWFGAWYLYMYYKTANQPPRFAILNVMGTCLIIGATFMAYASVPRKFSIAAINGNKEITEATYYGTTVFSPVYVFMTGGWAMLVYNQVFDNLFRG